MRFLSAFAASSSCPPGLTPNVPAGEYAANPLAMAVALEARRLVELRDRWLNPPEWVEWVDEPVPGYPKRLDRCRYRPVRRRA